MRTEQARRELVKHLAEKMRANKFNTPGGPVQPATFVPHTKDTTTQSEVTEWDTLLPGDTFRQGGIAEILYDTPGSGATSFACGLGKHLAEHVPGTTFVVVDRSRTYFPVAARQCGIPLHRLVVLQPTNDRDELWAIEQSLRCAGVAVVFANFSHVAERMGRRLMLASEVGQTAGIVLRAEQQVTICWSTAQLRVSPLATNSPVATISTDGSLQRAIQVDVLRLRGTGFQRRSFNVELPHTMTIAGRQTSMESDHGPRPVCLASELAPATSTTKTARAS